MNEYALWDDIEIACKWGRVVFVFGLSIIVGSHIVVETERSTGGKLLDILTDTCKARHNIRTIASILAAVAVATCLCGCQTQQPTATGFLTDYSRLRFQSGDTLEYVSRDINNYSGFLIEPVVIYFHQDAKGKFADWEDLKQLKSYMHSVFVDALGENYSVVSYPGPRVARVRMAITDIRKTDPWPVGLYTMRFAGGGVGGATMEAEVLDSMTGVQLAAIVQNNSARGLSPPGGNEWSDTQAVMDAWAKRFRWTLDYARKNEDRRIQITKAKGR